ncbi:nuclear transport factor 2 family protein [Aeromonas schubertii]|uniref:SnoaL-like domain-containing protein n=1 Tax=Aeromonas schubertii TaxID=652 RepID=A0A0S2SK69_9GAMM|nr:nuclear transport factor 2 family protein [Aeromonas schubertii]ALP42109.1 hypothetical protein WL1483_2690 [Aeromonas schubertii]
MIQSRQWAQELLAWNRHHLRAEATLDEAAIGERFAEHFTVRANGREYQTDRPGYLAFLQGFRASNATIDYRVQEWVCEPGSAVLAMQASVTRLSGKAERFEAILLLRFDERGLITLWQELYLPSPQ